MEALSVGQEGSAQTVMTVRPEQATQTKQGLGYFLGVSRATTGARGLCMHLVTIPPGGKAAPHRHRGFETAIYVLEGHVETRYGEGLTESVVNGPGDFLFIPPDIPHQACNLSATEAARAIVARNDPNEQESVVPYTLPEAVSGNA